MKFASIYVDRKTIVHSVDPISKLCYVAFAVLFPIVVNDIKIYFLFIAVNLCILATGKVLRNSFAVFGFVLIILSTVVLIQGLFGVNNQTPVFTVLEQTFYKEGLLRALVISQRVINIVASFMALVLTTKPDDLVSGLEKIGLSPKLGYVVVSVFQIIPQMMSTIDTITDAQRARGMETEGKLMTRIKAFFPLIGPVVLNSLVSTKERAMALEVRGFDSKLKKTYLMEQAYFKYGVIIRVGAAVMLAGACIWRIVGWIK